MKPTRRGWTLLALGVAVAAAVVTPVAVTSRMDSACADRVAAQEAEVHTDRRFTAADIDGIGDYTSVWWTVDFVGDCVGGDVSEARVYRALFVLGPSAASALSTGHEWKSAPAVTSTRPDQEDAIGPHLTPYTAAGTRWSTSADLTAVDLGAYTGSLFFDADHGFAYVRFW